MMNYGKNLMLAVAGTAILAGCGSPLSRVRLTGAQTQELTAAPINSDLAAGKRALAVGQYGAAVAALRLARLDPACSAEATNGLGVAYAFTPAVSARLELQKPGSDATNVSLGLAYQF